MATSNLELYLTPADSRKSLGLEDTPQGDDVEPLGGGSGGGTAEEAAGGAGGQDRADGEPTPVDAEAPAGADSHTVLTTEPSVRQQIADAVR